LLLKIGYHGDTAIVDGTLKRKYGTLPSLKLAEEGLFKAAISYAVYQGNEEDLQKVLDIYNAGTNNKIESVSDLKRLFGVTKLPEGISNINII
jgi:hypothetical protein